jgi:hypothetical protein
MKASNMNTSGPTSFLFKGPFGFGKTLAAASFALAGPVYLAYFDKKKPVELKTYFEKFGEKGKRILENIDYDIYGSNNANQYLNKMIDFSTDCRFTAVITDSITTMTSSVVNWSSNFDSKGKKVGLKTENPQQIIPSFDEYKSETAVVAQVMDLSRTFPAHVIWIAHPLPSTKIEGSGSSMKVTKVNSFVTYGSKVAGMVPGQFSEIYQFSKSIDYSVNPSRIRYIIDTDSVGDEFAKTALNLPKELDISNRLFYEVWLEALELYKPEVQNEVTTPASSVVNPFASQSQANQVNQDKKWNSEKGVYE